jgi:hypothetical protein
MRASVNLIPPAERQEQTLLKVARLDRSSGDSIPCVG